MRGRKRAHEAIKEACEMVRKRNKLIEIVDGSAASWDTVAEYEREEVGDDEEDKRRIKAAEKKALAKIKAKEATNGKRYTARGDTARTSTTRRQNDRSCYNCGKLSHFIRDCPSLPKDANTKRYDISNLIVVPRVLSVDKSNTDFPSRLTSRVNYWKDVLKASHWVLDIVENGYKLPFISKPGKNNFQK